jgi:hypothetical protein
MTIQMIDILACIRLEGDPEIGSKHVVDKNKNIVNTKQLC